MSVMTEMLLADIQYSAWANQRLLAAVSVLNLGEVERDLRISHTNIVATLIHIYDGERVWLDCLRTSPQIASWSLPTGPAPELSLETLKREWPIVWIGYRQWIQGMSEAELAVERMIELPGGSKPRLPRWKILRHVLDHSTLHRGQVVGMIRMLGHVPPAINRMDSFFASDVAGPMQAMLSEVPEL
jgi:uncharacterized damage-inducible protein DinB